MKEFNGYGNQLKESQSQIQYDGKTAKDGGEPATALDRATPVKEQAAIVGELPKRG